MPTSERKTSKRHSYINRAFQVIGCAAFVVLIFCLADPYGLLDTVNWHRQSRWDFGIKHLISDGAETFHTEIYELHLGPLAVSYCRIVTDGPVMQIQRITVGKQREVEIFAQRVDAESTVLLYRFSDLQKRIKTVEYRVDMFDSTIKDFKFDFISSQNGEMVGITERSSPGVVIILHDFSSGFNWPGTPRGTQAAREERLKQAETYLAQLAKDNPLRNLELGKGNGVAD